MVHRLHFATFCLPLLLAAGCGDDEKTAGPPVSPEKQAILDLLSSSCDDALDAVYDDLPAPAGYSAQNRGDVTRCAYDRRVPVDEMQAMYAEFDLDDPGITTAVHKLRVQYWTEREVGEPVATSAVIYVPETRRRDPAPVVVLGHGSVGVADICAPSKEDPDGFDKDWRTLVYTLAGDGFVVIMPDFPGLGTKGAGTWMHSLDEGHAMLDATRAIRKVMKPASLSDHNTLVGHSMGGHAALSAHSYAKVYGADGSIDAVMLFNPFWVSNAAWGALISPIGTALVDPLFLSLTVQYFLGHIEAYEGEGARTTPFLADKAQEVIDLHESACWHIVTREETGLPALGLDLGADLYTQEFIDSVGGCGGLETCDTPLAETWRERWVADRPPPDTDIPVVYWMGAKDDFVVPGFQQCGIDRLEAQGANMTVCVEEGSSHSDILVRTASDVRAYLDATLGGAATAPDCPGLEVFGEPPTCELPIANSLDPQDP